MHDHTYRSLALYVSMLANLCPIGGKLRKSGRNSRTCCRNATSPLPRGSWIATADPRAEDQAAGEGGRDGPLVAGELEEEAGRAAAGLCRSRGPLGCRAHARRLPAAGFCRRGAQAEAGARPGRGWRGFPAPGRGLRREFRRALRRQYPRFFSSLPTDGGGDDVRPRLAGVFFCGFSLRGGGGVASPAASPVVKFGRIAGQFAKPRSAPME